MFFVNMFFKNGITAEKKMKGFSVNMVLQVCINDLTRKYNYPDYNI